MHLAAAMWNAHQHVLMKCTPACAHAGHGQERVHDVQALNVLLLLQVKITRKKTITGPRRAFGKSWHSALQRSLQTPRQQQQQQMAVAAAAKAAVILRQTAMGLQQQVPAFSSSSSRVQWQLRQSSCGIHS
jgi:hypothetical protein